MRESEYKVLERNELVKVGLASKFKGSVGLVRGKDGPSKEHYGYIRIFTTRCQELYVHYRHVHLHQIEKEI